MGVGQFRCSLCMRRGKGKGGSCPNGMCLGKLGVQVGRVRRPKRKENRRKVTLRSVGGNRRGKIREYSSGSSGLEFEPQEWDPQVAQGGSLKGVQFTRGGWASQVRERDVSPPEVWLSLWDGKELEGCAALQR